MDRVAAILRQLLGVFKFRNKPLRAIHGPCVNGCAERFPVRDVNIPGLASTVKIAKKHNVRFRASDFKDGDIIRLKENEHIVCGRGGACVVERLLFDLDNCCRTRDKLLAAVKGNEDLVHSESLSLVGAVKCIDDLEGQRGSCDLAFMPQHNPIVNH
jgi:hypothetical protein